MQDSNLDFEIFESNFNCNCNGISVQQEKNTISECM